MILRTQCFILALTIALLIVLGGFGLFTAEASSIRIIVSEAHNAQAYGTPFGAPSYDADATDFVSVPGAPY